MGKKLLKTTQDIFWKMITAPEGVEEGLEQNPHVRLEHYFRGDKKLPPLRRLNIYANMYFWRIHDALKEDFPTLERLAGPQGWHHLMVDYLVAQPSQSPLLQHVGQFLPTFLETYSLSEEKPYLADVAKFEWAQCIVFDKREDPSLTKEDLDTISLERWPELILKTIDAFEWLELDWDVLKTPPQKKKTNIAVWRHDFVIYHQSYHLEEAQALKRIQKGDSFANICELLGSAEKSAQFLMQSMAHGFLKKY